MTREYLLNLLTTSNWLMSPSYLENGREFLNKAIFSPELLDKTLSEVDKRSSDITYRGDIAILSVVGPIVRYGGIDLCGGTTQSTESISKDFDSLMNNDEVKGVIMKYDTPGGQATSVGELSEQIRNARGKKPIVSYIDGYAASAGFWYASASDKIVISRTGQAGSVGAVARMKLNSEDEENKYIEIVSKQSPNKRVDISTSKGKEQYQEVIDDLAQAFIDGVAINRGITSEKVLSDYGQGKTFVGEKAVAAGLADEIGTLDSVIEDMRKQIDLNNGITNNNNLNGGISMSNNLDKKDSVDASAATPDVATITADAVSTYQLAEKSRMDGIKSAFSDSGLTDHTEMTGLLTDPTKTEVDALKACNSILKTEKTELSAATKEVPKTSATEAELAARNADALVVDAVSQEGESVEASTSGMDTEAFAAGMEDFNGSNTFNLGGK